MLFIYKIKHNRDFSAGLQKSQQVAKFCIKHRTQNRSLDSLLTPESVSYDYNYPVFPFHSKQLGNYEKNQKKRRRKRMKTNSLSLADLFPLSDPLYPEDVKHIGLKSTISS